MCYIGDNGMLNSWILSIWGDLHDDTIDQKHHDFRDAQMKPGAQAATWEYRVDHAIPLNLWYERLHHFQEGR